MIGMRCNKWFVSLACLLFGMWGKTIWGQSVYPFQDAGNPIEQRVEDIIRRMKLTCFPDIRILICIRVNVWGFLHFIWLTDR